MLPEAGALHTAAVSNQSSSYVYLTWFELVAKVHPGYSRDWGGVMADKRKLGASTLVALISSGSGYAFLPRTSPTARGFQGYRRCNNRHERSSLILAFL